MELAWHELPFEIKPFGPSIDEKDTYLMKLLKEEYILLIHAERYGKSHFSLSIDDFIRLIKLTSLYTGEIECPHCSQNKFVKYGKSYKGKQRYLCRSTECRARVFTINSHQLT